MSQLFVYLANLSIIWKSNQMLNDLEVQPIAELFVRLLNNFTLLDKLLHRTESGVSVVICHLSILDYDRMLAFFMVSWIFFLMFYL